MINVSLRLSGSALSSKKILRLKIPIGRGRTDLKKYEQDYRVRECNHRDAGAEGEFYRGSEYVKHIQRMNTDTAMRIASNITPFFWADAPQILVWLCRDCASELRLPVQESDAA